MIFILFNYPFMSERTEVEKILNELEIELKEDIASLTQELEDRKIRLARVSKAQKELRYEKTNSDTMNNDVQNACSCW